MSDYSLVQMAYIDSVEGNAHQSAIDIIARLEFALDEHEKYNPLRNDLDAYLLSIIKYARGEIKDKPIPEEYGLI